MFEIQSKWVAAVLSGRVILPSEDKMMEDIIEWYATLDVLGIPKRHTHKLGKISVSRYLPNMITCENIYRFQLFQH